MLSKKNNKETNTKIAVCYRFFLLLAVIFVLGNFLILPAQAQFVENLDGTSALDGSAGLDAIEDDINLQSMDIRTFIARIINIVLGFIGIILLILIMYAGYMYMTSAGDPEKVNLAKNILKNATIGLIIILASFGIVQFILWALSGGGGRMGGGQDGPPPYDVGVGALGSGIIESHYPERDQQDVARNTSIIVTFKEAIDKTTICIITENDCFLNDDAVKIYVLDEGENNALNSKDVKVTSTGDNKTFIFDPVPDLGNSSTNVWYEVKIEEKLDKADGEAVDLGFEGFYAWKFEINTELDFVPPHVSSVFPFPDNEQDTKSDVQEALQAEWDIEVGSPDEIKVYKKSDYEATTPTGVSVEGAYQNCLGSEEVKFAISVTNDSDNKLAVALNDRPENVRGFNGESLIIDQVANIGCGLSVVFASEPIVEEINDNNKIIIDVIEEQDGDTITIQEIEYMFGRDITYNEDESENDLAGYITTALKNIPSVKVKDRDAVVTLIVKSDVMRGERSNQLQVFTTADGDGLKITKTQDGRDQGSKFITKGLEDQPRNAVVQINFNEAVHPVFASGLTHDDSDTRQDINNYIQVQCVDSKDYKCDSDQDNFFECDGNVCLKGEFKISNVYRTVEFISTTLCGENSCGEDVFCLPPLANIAVKLNAASLYSCDDNDEDCLGEAGGNGEYGECDGGGTCEKEGINYPQVDLSKNLGIMDLANNSLDGDKDGIAEGPQSQSNKPAFDENELIATCSEDATKNQGMLCTKINGAEKCGNVSECRYASKYNNGSVTDADLRLEGMQTHRGDDYTWSFWTTDEIILTSPIIERAIQTDSDPPEGSLGILNLVEKDGQPTGASRTFPTQVQFNRLMMSSTIKPGRGGSDDIYPNSENYQREYFATINYSDWPMGYWCSKENIDTDDNGYPDKTVAITSHTRFKESQAYGFLVGSGVRDIYQNCYNPAGDEGADETANGGANGESECNAFGKTDAGQSCCLGVKQGDAQTMCYTFE